MLEETIAQQRVAGFSPKHEGRITGKQEAKIINSLLWFCLNFKIITVSFFPLGISASC